MYKIAVIGDRDSVLGFMAVGFSVFPTESAEEAARHLHRLVKEEYAVIYLTEELAEALSEDIAKYKDDPLPAIIPLPSRAGTLGLGLGNIKKSVERAVGADILFREE
ncbi:MAG: V-type ATP synthase subunit F [Ruminococcus sp.]|nr:V-type ATP synthase subunit F [Candidatus Apopatosoma intestinale]